jgi:hypothetical protein
MGRLNTIETIFLAAGDQRRTRSTDQRVGLIDYQPWHSQWCGRLVSGSGCDLNPNVDHAVAADLGSLWCIVRLGTNAAEWRDEYSLLIKEEKRMTIREPVALVHLT